MTKSHNLRKENELELPIWSVVSFEKTEASHLTYLQAVQELTRLKLEGVSGLCVVTEAAAERATK